MIQRRLLQQVGASLARSAAVALTGPRQVGKTTLAHIVSAAGSFVYLDLEDSRDKIKVAELSAFRAQHGGQLIILDEVQRVPQLFAQLRGEIDRSRRKNNRYGLFLLLGSASMELLRQSGESLAGRITYLELFPIDAVEYEGYEKGKTDTLWLRGGFPDSLLAASDADSVAWRRDFIRTYLERDIPQLGPKIPAQTLERFWTMLAHRQGSVFNAAQLAGSLDISGVTAARYLDLMVDLLLVRRLPAWAQNEGKRLVKAPRVYVRDSGLVHALLQIKTFPDLLAHPVTGASWEGFVIENILAVALPAARACYYRTAGGAEIDLLLEFSLEERWAIEVKRSAAPTVSKGFYSGCNDLKVARRIVVYSGEETFPMAHGVEAMSLITVMNKVAERLL